MEIFFALMIQIDFFALLFRSLSMCWFCFKSGPMDGARQTPTGAPTTARASPATCPAPFRPRHNSRRDWWPFVDRKKTNQQQICPRVFVLIQSLFLLFALLLMNLGFFERIDHCWGWAGSTIIFPINLNSCSLLYYICVYCIMMISIFISQFSSLVNVISTTELFLVNVYSLYL